MKYALVLENSTNTCNETSRILASMGYLITPVFSPKKALHAAHMIQFDLIVTCTTTIPDDRRSLTGELARCSPDATLILLAECDAMPANDQLDGVNSVLYRPLTAEDIDSVVESTLKGFAAHLPPPRTDRERRRKSVD
ncbi:MULTISPECIES: hypothetical protein [unclassified Massilia]|uniref:hypothetical protein n=1 Tax=unclassified Massilia TaxID=2609279 RepID=UPI000B14AE20|nr:MULTISPECIES: hypothetical protein [unclassified Massilia]